MRKWTIIILFILLIFVIQSIYLYNRASSPIKKAQETAVTSAKEQFNLNQIEEVTYFNGEEAYQVIRALDEQEEEIIIWVPEKHPEKALVEKAKDGLTEKEVKKFANAELDIKKIKDIRLGIKQGTPVWEIVFINSENRYSFYYLHFSGETWIENYRLKAI